MLGVVNNIVCICFVTCQVVGVDIVYQEPEGVSAGKCSVCMQRQVEWQPQQALRCPLLTLNEAP
jgi:hypothetical protein